MKSSSLRQYTVVIAAYLAIAVIMTWPLAADPSRYVISEVMDCVTAFYNLWWFEKALCDLHVSFWQSPLIDYPHGYSLALFPIWVPYDLIALPIVHCFGLPGVPVAFNLIYLLSFPACGLAAYVMVRYLARDRAAAFIAGLILAFLPYRFWNVTRWHVTCLELVVPCLYFFLRLVRGDLPRAWIYFAISAVLLAYTSPNYAADVFLALAIVLVWAAIFEHDGLRRRQTWTDLFKAGLLVALACSPFIIKVGMDAAGSTVPLVADEASRGAFSANLAAYAVPGFTQRAYHAIVGGHDFSDLALKRPHGVVGYELFAGYVALALAAVGLARGRKTAALFGVLVAVFIVLSLGPRLNIGAWTSQGPTPYRLLEAAIPWLKIERAPARHAAIAYIGLAVLAGLGLAHLRGRMSGLSKKALPAIAGAAILLEFFQAPLPVNVIPIPDFVTAIKQDPTPGAVLDLPQLPLIKRFAGIHQMTHERPLAIQLTRRVEDPAYHASAIYKFLDQPRHYSEMTADQKAVALAEVRAEFTLRQIRYVVLYQKFIAPEDLEALRLLLAELEPERMEVIGDTYLIFRFRHETA